MCEDDFSKMGNCHHTVTLNSSCISTVHPRFLLCHGFIIGINLEKFHVCILYQDIIAGDLRFDVNGCSLWVENVIKGI